MAITGKCKQIITSQTDGKRRCRMRIWADFPEDGYCHLHHPETIEHGIVIDILHEQKRADMRRSAAVGRWLLRHDYDLFCEVEKKIVRHTPIL